MEHISFTSHCNFCYSMQINQINHEHLWALHWKHEKKHEFKLNIVTFQTASPNKQHIKSHEKPSMMKFNIESFFRFVLWFNDVWRFLIAYLHMNDLINDYCKPIICFAIVYFSLCLPSGVHLICGPFSPCQQLNNFNPLTQHTHTYTHCDHQNHFFRNAIVHENGEINSRNPSKW